MKTETYHVDGKEAALYRGAQADSPLILLNCFAGEGEAIMAEVWKRDSRDFSLLCVCRLDWNHDI